MEDEKCEHIFKDVLSNVKMRGTYDHCLIKIQQRIVIYCQKCGKIVFDSVLNDRGQVFKEK